MAKAIVNTVRPKASDTPSNPIPTLGNAAASTALPQPPRTSQKVPKNSAPFVDPHFDTRGTIVAPGGRVPIPAVGLVSHAGYRLIRRYTMSTMMAPPVAIRMLTRLNPVTVPIPRNEPM